MIFIIGVLGLSCHLHCDQSAQSPIGKAGRRHSTESTFLDTRSGRCDVIFVGACGRSWTCGRLSAWDCRFLHFNNSTLLTHYSLFPSQSNSAMSQDSNLLLHIRCAETPTDSHLALCFFDYFPDRYAIFVFADPRHHSKSSTTTS